MPESLRLVLEAFSRNAFQAPLRHGGNRMDRWLFLALLATFKGRAWGWPGVDHYCVASTDRAALRFARLMLESMHLLADRARRDPLFSDLAVYHAVSWLPPHGRRIGFITEPFPDGPRKRLLAVYFRLLVWAFAPAAQTRASARPDPTIYWLTRKQLLRRFGDVRDDVEERNGESLARLRAAT